MAGAGTLGELREMPAARPRPHLRGGASPRVLPFRGCARGGCAACNGLASRYRSPMWTTVTVRYDTMFDLMRRPARHGGGQQPDRSAAVSPASRELFVEAARTLCRERFCRPGRPHPSHLQHHLAVWLGTGTHAAESRSAPGSAQVSLADALQSQESRRRRPNRRPPPFDRHGWDVARPIPCSRIAAARCQDGRTGCSRVRWKTGLNAGDHLPAKARQRSDRTRPPSRRRFVTSRKLSRSSWASCRSPSI
jgi:hypothetical protein